MSFADCQVKHRGVNIYNVHLSVGFSFSCSLGNIVIMPPGCFWPVTARSIKTCSCLWLWICGAHRHIINVVHISLTDPWKVLSAGMSCDVTVALRPLLSGLRSLGMLFLPVRVAFDTHSSHNLVVSLSKSCMSPCLMLDPS